MKGQRKAIIIGAGPAGLTAAYELIKRTDVIPVVIEQSGIVGGISATFKYCGSRIDVGGHRFFTKSSRVLDWWLKLLPIQRLETEEQKGAFKRIYQQADELGVGPDPAKIEEVMLLRKRKSRIFYQRTYFDYPLQLNWTTIKKLGLVRMAKIAGSYWLSLMRPIKPERSLEDFFINRFGKELYQTFFKSYTEKLWGVQCNEIDPRWGAQRIKGLSVKLAIQHFFRERFKSRVTERRPMETSLIEYFLYPKHGPGQLWEKVAKEIQQGGGQLVMNRRVEEIETSQNKFIKLQAKNLLTGQKERWHGDYLLSSMAVKDLIESLIEGVPDDIRQIAEGLPYRAFITVGLMLNKKRLGDKEIGRIDDNWLYIQEADVKLGRIQIFNNWSPAMVGRGGCIWLGLEYFCSQGDEVWEKTDKEMIDLAIRELEQLKMIEAGAVMDSTVIRMPKAYPAYFGTYSDFPKVRRWLDGFDNIYPIGRNGQHRYNNQDHSMLTAMVAVDNIVKNIRNKDNVWQINTEKEYHESSSG